MIIKSKGKPDISGSDMAPIQLVNFSDEFLHKPDALRTFAYVTLKSGAEVEYHVHSGECESYHIISGKGIYNDNGNEVYVSVGDTTFTQSGHGHGLKNTSDDNMEFIALIVRDNSNE